MAIDPDVQALLDPINADLADHGGRIAALENSGSLVGFEVAPPAYPADAAPAMQAAMDLVDANRGGLVRVKQGRYRLATGLVSSRQGLVLEGEGMPGVSDIYARGSTHLVVADGKVGLTLGSAGSHQTRGYGIRNLHFISETGTGGGILLVNTESSILQDAGASNFTAGFGVKIDGGSQAGSNGQYTELRNLRVGRCQVGLHLAGNAPNGTRLLGGYLCGQEAGTPQAGTAILVERGDTLRLFGTVIQGWAVGVDLALNGGHELHGPRFEFCTTGLRVGAACRGVALAGGSFVNGGPGSVAVVVEAGARQVYLRPALVENVGQVFENGAPAETMIVYPGHAGWHPSQ